MRDIQNRMQHNLEYINEYKIELIFLEKIEQFKSNILKKYIKLNILLFKSNRKNNNLFLEIDICISKKKIKILINGRYKYINLTDGNVITILKYMEPYIEYNIKDIIIENREVKNKRGQQYINNNLTLDNNKYALVTYKINNNLCLLKELLNISNYFKYIDIERNKKYISINTILYTKFKIKSKKNTFKDDKYEVLNIF